MTRKLTDSAKQKRQEAKKRIIEDPKGLPDQLKQHTIETLYRIGKDPAEIAAITGIEARTVSRNVKRFKETGTCNPTPRTGRPLSKVTKQNTKKIRQRVRRDLDLASTPNPQDRQQEQFQGYWPDAKAR
jgi:transposase